MATVGQAPTLFLRKATGLVKGWSRFDAFVYSFMSVNFVTLGLFFALSVLAFVPTGQVFPALLMSGIFVTFLVITYASLISVMPRASARRRASRTSTASSTSSTSNRMRKGRVRSPAAVGTSGAADTVDTRCPALGLAGGPSRGRRPCRCATR